MMKYLILFFILKTAFVFGIPIGNEKPVISHNYDRDNGQIDFVLKHQLSNDLIDGDILIAKSRGHRERRATPIRESSKWPNNTVVYLYDTVHPINEEMMNLTKQAIEHISNYTCITFKEHTNENYYVNVTAFDSGCYSYLGFVDYGAEVGGQPLNLEANCNGIEVTVHEWLHALGFYHEHNRPDRDEHITVNFTNVKPEMMNQFNKVNLTHGDEAGPVTLQEISYDISSIMHYGQYSFTKHQDLTFGIRDQMTMYSKTDFNAKLGGYSLTEKDILRVNRKYGCEIKSNATTSAPIVTTPNGNQSTSNNNTGMVSTTAQGSLNMTSTTKSSGGNSNNMTMKPTTQPNNNNNNTTTTTNNNNNTTNNNNNNQTATTAATATSQQSTINLGNFTQPPANGTNTSMWGSTAAYQTPSHPITFVALFFGSLAMLSSFV